MEQWRKIEGYDHYEVSNLGNVRSNSPKHKGKLISQHQHHEWKYINVSLCKEGNPRKFTVSRLVAQAFIPNPENKPQVNHKDGNVLNNRVENLEWVTNKENIQHAWKNGAYGTGENHHCAKRVVQMDLDGNTIKIYGSVVLAAKETGFYKGSLATCCRGITNTSHGYKWEYVN